RHRPLAGGPWPRTRLLRFPLLVVLRQARHTGGHELEDPRRYLSRGLPHRFLHRDSLKEVLYGNVTDFQAFSLNHRLVMPRKKLQRLKTEPEQDWDLMWNTTLIYALFPNTLLMVQGDHVELARIFPSEGRVDRAVMELSLYVPNAPATDEERMHW